MSDVRPKQKTSSNKEASRLSAKFEVGPAGIEIFFGVIKKEKNKGHAFSFGVERQHFAVIATRKGSFGLKVDDASPIGMVEFAELLLWDIVNGKYGMGIVSREVTGGG